MTEPELDEVADASVGPPDAVPEKPGSGVWPVVLASFGAMFLSIATTWFILMWVSLLMALTSTDGFTGVDALFKEITVLIKIDTIRMGTGALGSSSALLLMGVFLVAKPRDKIRSRLRLWAPNIVDLILVSIGMLALTNSLSQLIEFLDLDKVGALAELNVMFDSWTVEEGIKMLPLLALAPGIGEEVFFRGYALAKLESTRGRTYGIFLSALLFGLIHGDPIHSFAAFVMGLYLAYVVCATNCLWLTIVAHIVNNALAVLFPNTTPESSANQWLMFGGSIVVFIVSFAIIRRRTRGNQYSAVW